MIWLKSHDIFYRSPGRSARSAEGNGLAKVFDDPQFFGFSLPEMADGPESRPLLTGLAGRHRNFAVRVV